VWDCRSWIGEIQEIEAVQRDGTEETKGARKCACEPIRESIGPTSAEGEKRERMNRETGTEGASERVISTFCGFAYIHRFSDFCVRIAKCATSYMSLQRQSPISSLVSTEYVLLSRYTSINDKEKVE